jgi:hypothetical protein
MTTVDDSTSVALWLRRAPMTLCLIALGLVAGRAAAQGTKGVSFQGQRGPRLAIEINGIKLTEWSVMAVPDTVIVTVSPQDSLGNPYPLVGYELQVFDPEVLFKVGSMVEARRAETRLVAKKRGKTTIQVRASGMRQWILVEVGANTLTLSPTANPPAQPGSQQEISSPIVGVRASYAHYEYTFHQQQTFVGQGGFIGEVYFGKDFGYGVVFVGGVGAGLVKVDSLTTRVTAQVLETYFRFDYSVFTVKQFSAVASGGGGAYRVRTGGDGSGIWNTSLYWMLGFGADVAVSRKLTLEGRMTVQELEELNSGHMNGHVGNLLVFGAGLRYQLR